MSDSVAVLLLVFARFLFLLLFLLWLGSFYCVACNRAFFVAGENPLAFFFVWLVCYVLLSAFTPVFVTMKQTPVCFCA